jgi:hypothetical protein
LTRLAAETKVPTQKTRPWKEDSVPCDYDAIEFWLKLVGGLAAVFALAATWRSHSERSTFEMIDKLYTLCHALVAHAMRDYYLSHMFAIGDKEYDEVKAAIQERITTDRAAIAEYRIKEKLFAIHVFIIYEQVYYQWSNTSEFFHPKRRKFLKDILSYFTDRLLVNPRLLYFLEADPKGESLHLEEQSKKYLNDVIAERKKKGKLRVDEKGPYEDIPHESSPSPPSPPPFTPPPPPGNRGFRL